MRGKGSDFSRYALQHIYQRAIDRGVIFYTDEDRIVYYSLAAVNSKRYRITITAASLMFTHTHQSIHAPSLESLRRYVHGINTSFSRLYNYRYSRKGRLFEKPFGCSRKVSIKEQKSCLIYVYNNHVEKNLCKKSIQERWSFLAYAVSNHPFSDELDFNKTSKTLQKAIRLVDRRIKRQKGIEYADLDRILPFLGEGEYEQFIDYIVSQYAWIDFKAAASLFGSIDSMILAIDSTTGGEYDIKEEYSSLADTPYLELAEFMEKEDCLKEVFSMPAGRKLDLIIKARMMTSAALYHLRKFFHLDFSVAR